MTTETKEKKGCDRTKELPTTIIWREALRFLEVGDYFTASQLDRTSIANQMTYLKDNEELEFTTSKINRDKFKVTRTK